MTVNEAKNKLIAWCKGQTGYTEGQNNWNKYATGKASAYGWDVQNQPWCDVFADCAFIECFGLDAASQLTYQPKGRFSALCSASADYYKENNAWYSYPEIGDQIFFYYSGGINHTGIVTDVSGGFVYTMEGNTSDIVAPRAYGLSSVTIAGYGRPNWSIFSGNSTPAPTAGEKTTKPSAPEPPAVKTCTVEITLPLLSQGDKGSWVKILQLRLIDKGQRLPKWGADGDFGNETRDAVERFQKNHGLVVDSVVGQATWKALGE